MFRGSLLLPALALAIIACGSSGESVDSVMAPVPVAGFGGLAGLSVPNGAPPARLSELRTAAKTPPPISGGTLAVDKSGTVAVVADSDRDLVFVVDLASGGVQKVKLASGSEPGRVALQGTVAAHVVLRGTGKLARIDLAQPTSATEAIVCGHPRGVAFDALRERVVVSCLDGQLVQLEASSYRELERKRELPSDLRDVFVGDNGVEAVTRYRSAELVRLNADQSIKSQSQPRKGQRFDSGKLFESNRAPVPANLSPALVWRTLRAPGGTYWMLHQQSQEEEVVLAVGGGYGSGGCSTITGARVSELNGEGATLRTMTVPLLGLSVDAALSPNQKWLAVASPGGYLRSTGTLQVYPTMGMAADETVGLCQTPSHSGGDENQTTAVAFDDNNVLYAYSREPAELQIFLEPAVGALGSVAPVGSSGGGFQFVGARLTRKASIALDLSSVRDTGHDLFHADVGQGLACASCHGEATDDGHVWTFEMIGPRRTQNMRGGLLATAPFHWDGDMPNVGHLVDEVMTRRMGGFQVMAPFADALGAWIDRQPALTLPVQDAVAADRGKTLFNAASTQCNSCHNGKNFTNNESKDVGTGGMFQVPGLLGLSLRAPYMHNGCAKTLEDRFSDSCGGGDKHGLTSKLSASQLADLTAYLKTL